MIAPSVAIVRRVIVGIVAEVGIRSKGTLSIECEDYKHPTLSYVPVEACLAGPWRVALQIYSTDTIVCTINHN